MSSPQVDGDAPHDVPASPPPSARVRLEVDILTPGHFRAPAPLTEMAGGDATRIVLLCAVDADVRQYLRECLREHVDVRIVETDSVAHGVELADAFPPSLLIMDRANAQLASALGAVRGIVIADEPPQQELMPDQRLTALLRPFSAESLSAVVNRLLT